jgi:ubiquinone/menaquinone biosynthesis C-methylase UbiE
MVINMSDVDFDQYVNEYRDIINQVSSISGEQYEYFIQLRLKLMKMRVTGQLKHFDKIKILDFGCGTGETEVYFKELFPDDLIYGVDSSIESIHAGEARNLEGVTFVHSDTFTLPFPDNYFDLIYSNGTYHHIIPEYHGKYLSEISRVCSDGGNLFIFENNPRNPLMMRAMKNNPFDKDAILVHPEWLEKITEASGFSNKEVCYYFFFPKFLSFLRFSEKWLSNIPFGAQYFLWSIKSVASNKI